MKLRICGTPYWFFHLTALTATAVSIRRIDTVDLHRVYDNMLQRAQKCIDVQGDHFQHLLWPVSTLHLHSFNFLYRVRDLRPCWSTRRRAGFSCAILYNHAHNYLLPSLFNISTQVSNRQSLLLCVWSTLYE